MSDIASSSKRPEKRPRNIEIERRNSDMWFIWDDLTHHETIPQPPLKQNPDSCAFAACSRQVEYDMRVRWAMATPPSKLDPGPLLDHVRWERRLEQKFPNHVGLWKPKELLEQTLHEDLENPDRKERVGCPYMRGLDHETHARVVIPQHRVTVDEVHKVLSCRIPLVAVIEVRGDYPEYAEYPYLGVKKVRFQISRDRITRVTHAVVLVGMYKVKAGNPYGLEPDTYWVYQNSCEEEPPKKPSLLENGFNLLHQRVIIELYYGITFPPAVLAASCDVERLQRRYNLIRQQRREEKDIYMASRGAQ